MTAPERPDSGADDDYATEIRQWIDEGYAIPPEVTRLALPLPMPPDIDDIPYPEACSATAVGERAGELETRCLCPHVKRLHHGRDHTGPCTRPCGCTGYRDLAQYEADREVAMERAIEAAADARAELAAELNGYDPEED